MSKFFSHILPILLVLLVPIFATVSLFHPGYFTMHDDQQIARLYELTKVIHDGQLPPRWVPDLGYGFGYPLFVFYPPLVYYVGFVIHSMGFSFINSTKIVMGLGFILPSLFMYLWIKNRAGKAAGVIAAILYVFAPYHGVDLYVRGAFAEYFSFVWIPGVFWALDNLVRTRKSRWVIVSGVLLSLVVVTHDLIALQFAPFIGLYILFILWEGRKEFISVCIRVLCAGGIALCLSCFFWLPSLLEKQYTLVDAILTKELASYQLHFVCIRQLWSSPWGYGGSVPDCNDGLSFEIGKGYVIGFLFAIVCSFFGFFKKRKENVFLLFLIVNTIIAAAFTTHLSAFIWKIIHPFAYIQFPWRFLLFVDVFISASIGTVIGLLPDTLKKFVGVPAGVVLILTAGLFVYQNFHPAQYLQKTDADYISQEDVSWRISGTSFEYVPRQVATTKSNIDTTQLAITHADIPHMPASVISGSMSIQVVKNISWDKVFDVTVLQSGVLQLNTYSFPGWKLYVDGKQVKVQDNNKLHLIHVYLQQGKHRVEIRFGETPVRLTGDWVSFVSLIAVLVSILVLYKSKKL